MEKRYLKDEHGFELFNPKEKFTTTITYSLTAEEIEDIMVSAIEGGIGYWAQLDNDDDSVWRETKGMPASQRATEILLAGGEIKFIDTESDEICTLTLDKLFAGYVGYTEEYDFGWDDLDAEVADGIIQYAIFGEIQYG